MGVQTVIKHAQIQGGDVSLAKPGDAPAPVRPALSQTRNVDVTVAWRALGDSSIGADARWGVPAWQVREWVTSALAAGRYAEASAYSALLHV